MMDWNREDERERNTELLKLLPVLNNKSKDLQSSSQIMEDMEQQLAIQTVVINNIHSS